MSAVHASEVDQPKRAYPLAILRFSRNICYFDIGEFGGHYGSRPAQLSVTTGVIQAFDMIFAPYHNRFLLPLATIFIVLGSISSVVTWIIGPTKDYLLLAMTAVYQHGLQKPMTNKCRYIYYLYEAVVLPH